MRVNIQHPVTRITRDPVFLPLTLHCRRIPHLKTKLERVKLKGLGLGLGALRL